MTWCERSCRRKLRSSMGLRERLFQRVFATRKKEGWPQRGPPLQNCPERLLIGCRRRNGIASEVRHPNFRSIKGHGERTFAGCVSSHHGSTERTNFHHSAVAIVDHPMFRSVKRYSRRSITDLERAEIEPVDRAKLRHGAGEIVCDPNIGTFRSDSESTSAHFIRTQHGAGGA